MQSVLFLTYFRRSERGEKKRCRREKMTQNATGTLAGHKYYIYQSSRAIPVRAIIYMLVALQGRHGFVCVRVCCAARCVPNVVLPVDTTVMPSL